jgi:putative flippase GtrA
VATGWACFNAWAEQQQRTLPLDLDGWGHLVTRLQENGHSFWSLLVEPSLWKGPVVPFLFGLCYYVAPFASSVLVFNAIVFGLAVGLLFLSFCRLGANRVSAAIAVLGWVFYLPNKMVFGYYFAEPVISALSVGLFALAASLITRPRAATALGLGAVAGLLVLARAPFVPVVAGLPLVLWQPLQGYRVRYLGLAGAGLLLTFAPWPIRNLIVEHEFVPFTTEGGKILYQGTYLHGDDVRMALLRELPEFQQIEAGEAGMTPVEQYRYWKSLAVAQVREAPLAEMQLCIRKAVRFWVYLPAHSWVPAWKTALVALLCLPLAAFGVLRGWRDPLIQLCTLWVGGLWAFHTVVHAELRYNFPVLPTLFCLSVYGARHLYIHGLAGAPSLADRAVPPGRATPSRLFNSSRVSQIGRFLLIGGLSTALDFVIYTCLCKSGMDPLPAKGFAYGCGICFGFAGNKLWTFRSKRRSLVEPVSYLLIYGSTLAVNAVLNRILLTLLAGTALNTWGVELAFIGATATSMMLNYSGLRAITFRKGWLESKTRSGSELVIQPIGNDGSALVAPTASADARLSAQEEFAGTSSHL